MPISSTGFGVDVDFEKEHCYDPSLSQSICTFLKSRNVQAMYDFGCGPGEYVRKMRSNGIQSTGYDGNPITSSIPFCNVADLTDPNFTLPPLECVMCLEVGEHIPAQYEDALIRTLDKHVLPGGILILSWAVPGQGGLGHVNCQTNQYVRNRMAVLGYTPLLDIETKLRNSATLSWFKNTVLVFEKTPTTHAVLNGGLGNRLFKLASLCAKYPRRCTCDAVCSTVHSDADYMTSIFTKFPRSCKGVKSIVHLDDQRYHEIERILPEFIQTLSLPDVPKTDTAFLHIRGGDYVNHSLHHVPLELYYMRAIRHFPNDTVFYIFTNDIEYAKTQPVLSKIRHEFIECDEITALAMMKQCSRGGICANSSFSWWGAVLDTNRTLVIPSKWTTSADWNASSNYRFPGAIVEPVTIDVHCIHLPHRTDRLAHIQRMKDAYPCLNIRLVDAAHEPSNGALGCMKSHKQIIRRAKADNLPYVFVIEDDCNFLLPNTQLLNTIVAAIEYLPTVDIVNGCGNLVKFEITQTETHGATQFLRSPDVRTTHCILYGASSYDKVLAFPEQTSNGGAIDERLNSTTLVYTFPYMASQLSGHSDIMHMNVEYNNIQRSIDFVTSAVGEDGQN